MREALIKRIGEIALCGADGHRCAAIQTLGEIPTDHSVSVLLQALLDDDEDVRIDAAAALGQLGVPEVGEALLENLINDPSDEVKIEALKALVSLQCSPAIPWLRKLVLSRPAEMAWDDSSHEGWDDWLDLQIITLDGLGQFRDVEAIPLIQQAMADEEGQDLTEEGASVFARMGDHGFEALIALLANGDERTRRVVAKNLGQMSPPMVSGHLTGLVNDEAASVRLAAAKSIHQQAPDDTRLLPLFWDTDPTLRVFGVSALGKTNPGWVKKCLQDESALVVEAALEIVACVEMEGLEDQLAVLVDDAGLGLLAVRAIARQNKGLALDILERELSEGNPQAMGLVLEIAQNEATWPNRAAKILLDRLPKQKVDLVEDLQVSEIRETEGISTLEEIIAPKSPLPEQSANDEGALQAVDFLGYLARKEVLLELVECIENADDKLRKALTRSIVRLLQEIESDDDQVSTFIAENLLKPEVLQGLAQIRARWKDEQILAHLAQSEANRLPLILCLDDKERFQEELVATFDKATFSQQQQIVQAVADAKDPNRVSTLMGFACRRDGELCSCVKDTIQEVDKPLWLNLLHKLLSDDAQKEYWPIAMRLADKVLT